MSSVRSLAGPSRFPSLLLLRCIHPIHPSSLPSPPSEHPSHRWMSSTQLNSKAVPSHAQTQTLLLPPLPSLSPPSSRSVSFAFGTHASNLVHISRSTDPLMIELSKKANTDRKPTRVSNDEQASSIQSGVSLPPSLPFFFRLPSVLVFTGKGRKDSQTHSKVSKKKAWFPNTKSQIPKPNESALPFVSFRFASTPTPFLFRSSFVASEEGRACSP